ncbi:MAG: MFS transporter [Oscillospiraceae bacterium]|jgi:MFS family permease|nr:MFS transporter [Oscillospiraceae bacterium]
MKILKIFDSIWAKIIAAAVIILAISFVICNLAFFHFHPLNGGCLVKNPVCATIDNKDEIIIINDSGSVILGIDKKNEIKFLKKSDTAFLENFKNIQDVCCDYGGNVYIHSIKRIEGYKIVEESILKFSSNGGVAKTIFKENYEEGINKSSIRKISINDGMFYYITADNEGFYLYNAKNTKLRKFDYKNALFNILEYDIKKSLNTIDILTKKGEFIRFSKDNSTILYDINSKSDQNFENTAEIPIKFTVTTNGNIIYSDIGSRKVYFFDVVTREKKIIIDCSENIIYENPIYYTFYAEENIKDELRILAPISGNYIRNSILDWKNGEFHNHFSFNYSRKIIINYILFYFCLSLILFFFILLFIFLVKKIMKSKKTIIKNSFLVFIGAVALTGMFSVLTLDNFKQRMENEILGKARTASLLIDKNIPIDSIEHINQSSDFDKEDYTNLRRYIKNLFSNDNDFMKGLYCTIYKITHDNLVVSSVYDTNEETPAIYPMYPFNEKSEEYKMTKTKEQKTYNKPISTQEGTFVFVLSPIINEDGNVSGFLEVGTNIDSIDEANRGLTVSLFLNIVSISIFAILCAIEISEFIKNYKKNLRMDKMHILYNKTSKTLVFLIMLSLNIVSFFSPIYIIQMAPETKFFPKELLICIPIAIEFLFRIFALPLGRLFIKLFKKRNTAIISSILFFLGLVIRIILPDIRTMTLGNAIIGIGSGIILLIAGDSFTEKNEYFHLSNFSNLSGMTCGIILGSFLINWVNYFSIYVISAIIGAITIFFSIFCVCDSEEEILPFALSGVWRALRFAFSKRIRSYFMFTVIPMIICTFFIRFMLPLKKEDFSLSDSHIGYLYMLSLLFPTFLGKILADSFFKVLRKRLSILLGMLICASALFVFYKYQTVYVLILSVFLIGIATAFTFSIQSKHYLDIPEVSSYGKNKAVVPYYIVENLAMVIGPVVFSFITRIENLGLPIICGSLAVFAIIFLLSNLNRKFSSANLQTEGGEDKK